MDVKNQTPVDDFLKQTRGFPHFFSGGLRQPQMGVEVAMDAVVFRGPNYGVCRGAPVPAKLVYFTGSIFLNVFCYPFMKL